MNKNLLKLPSVELLVFWLAQHLKKQKRKNGVNAWHAPKCNVFPNPG